MLHRLTYNLFCAFPFISLEKERKMLAMPVSLKHLDAAPYSCASPYS